MSRHKCSEELYRAFLQATSGRYSNLSLSEVSPLKLSHDSVSRWLQETKFRPREIWNEAKKLVDKKRRHLLICDDAILSKKHSKKIEMVQHQYSGNEHSVIAGIGLVNLLYYEIEQEQKVPIDYRIYDKKADG